MKTVDLHVHSRLSKSFEYEHDNLLRLIKLGRRRGLDGFALTEHIHAVNFWAMQDRLTRTFDYRDGAYRVERDFSVLSGAEVTVAERVDFIVLGRLDQLHDLDNAFTPRLSDWNHVPAMRLAEETRKRDMTLILAHPYRLGKEAAKLSDEIYELVHAVEVNGRDHGGERQVVTLAQQHNVPLSGGSDAHFYLQVGIRAVMAPVSEVCQESLRETFVNGRTRVHAKPYARPVVELCQEIKRVTKWQNAALFETSAVA